MKKITLLLLSFISLTTFAQETIVDANFANYTAGALVGQNSWVQYNTNADRALTVSSGKITWTGGNTTDGQDAMLPFASTIGQPTNGVTTVNFDIVLSVASAGAAPSYFLALNTLNTTVTTNNFQNARIAAKTSGNGFVFGARVNGQSGYPFAYGTTTLTFGTTYYVRAQLKLVSGNQNDTLKLYVGDSFENLSLYSTSAYSSGTVGDPVLGAVLISQFGNATTFESGVSISSIKVVNLGTTVTGFNTPTTKNLKAIVSGKNLVFIGDESNGATVEIYSALGAKVQTSVIDNGRVELNNLQKGIYIVRLGKQTQKIVL